MNSLWTNFCLLFLLAAMPVAHSLQNSCGRCPFGQYGTTWSTECLAICPPGSAQLNVSSSCCDLCSPGQFSNLANNHTYCDLCPPQTYCPQPGTLTPTLCPPGTFYNQTGATSCYPCPAGKYCSVSTITLFSSYGQYGANCPQGSYNPNQGATNSSACITCTGAGIYCAAGSTSQTLCPEGYYCPSLSSIYTCPAGTYSLSGATSSSSCLPCTATGSYCPGGTSFQMCPAGMYCATASALVPCPAGTYNPTSGKTSSSACLACSGAGIYCPTGSASQIQCPQGFYCSSLTSLIPCPVGTYNPNTGSSSVAACITCTGNGTYCPAGSSSQKPCPESSYCPTVSLLISCPEGSYTLTAGNTSPFACIICPRGTFCDGFTSINICPGGFYCPAASNEMSLQISTACPAGTFNPNVGSTDLSACIPCTLTGSHCLSGSNSQTPCPAGSYCPSVSTSVQCPAGTYNPNTGSTAVTACLPCTEVGTYCQAGSSVSMPCPAGFYCPSASTFNNCPTGTYNPNTGATSLSACITCTLGNYCLVRFGNGVTSQTPCPAGGYCPSPSQLLPCSDGTYTPNAGSTSSSACVACPLGYLCSQSWVPTFTGPCPSGYYCTTPSTYTACPAGTILAPVGSYLASACVPCTAPGSYCPQSGQYSCYASTGCFCPAGGYCTNATTFIQCPSGFYNSNPGATSLSDCTPCTGYGMYCPTGSKGQALCPLGSYCPSPSSYVRCPLGSYNLNLGSTSPNDCLTCPAGNFCPSQIGSYLISPCPPGTYNPNSGNTTSSACLPCTGIGAYCALGSFSQIMCPSGHYCSSASTSIPCPAGTYNPNNGTTNASACSLCPKDSQSTVGSSRCFTLTSTYSQLTPSGEQSKTSTHTSSGSPTIVESSTHSNSENTLEQTNSKTESFSNTLSPQGSDTLSKSGSKSISESQTQSPTATSSSQNSNTFSIIHTSSDSKRFSQSSSIPSNSRSPTLTGRLVNTLTVNPFSPVVVSATQTTLAIASLAGVVVGVPGSVAQSSRGAVALRIASCEENTGPEGNPLDWNNSPTRLSIGNDNLQYDKGALVGNWLILGVTAGVHVGLAKYFGKSEMRYPSVLILPALFLAPGTATSAMNLIRYGATGEKVLGTSSMLAQIIGTSSVVFLLLPPRFQAQWNSKESAWTDNSQGDYLKRYDFFFKEYRHLRQWFAAAELSFSLTEGSLEAFSNADSNCFDLQMVALIVYGSEFILYSYLRPSSETRGLVYNDIVVGAKFLGVLLSAIGTKTDSLTTKQVGSGITVVTQWIEIANNLFVILNRLRDLMHYISYRFRKEGVDALGSSMTLIDTSNIEMRSLTDRLSDVLLNHIDSRSVTPPPLILEQNVEAPDEAEILKQACEDDGENPLEKARDEEAAKNEYFNKYGYYPLTES